MENKETGLQKSNQSKEVSFISKEQLQKYEAVDNAVGELMSSGLTGMALTVAKITVVEKIESILDNDFMAKVMNLKNKEYGFKTDERSGENYPESKIKPAIVQAMMFGAEITGNEFNILGGNCYLTKNFCKNWLRKNKIWYKIPCAMSAQADNKTWFIRVFAEWLDFEQKKHKETIDIPVAKHATTSEATMKGCAERDAMAYIIEELRKESLPMDKREDYTVDTTYEEVKEKKSYSATPVYNDNVKPEVKVESNPEIKVEQAENARSENQEKSESLNPEPPKLQMVDANTQAEFDKFIDNKSKIKTIQDLTSRAKNFCNTKAIQSSQLNFDKFNSIKAEIDNGSW